MLQLVLNIITILLISVLEGQIQSSVNNKAGVIPVLMDNCNNSVVLCDTVVGRFYQCRNGKFQVFNCQSGMTCIPTSPSHAYCNYPQNPAPPSAPSPPSGAVGGSCPSGAKYCTATGELITCNANNIAQVSACPTGQTCKWQSQSSASCQPGSPPPGTPPPPPIFSPPTGGPPSPPSSSPPGTFPPGVFPPPPPSGSGFPPPPGSPPSGGTPGGNGAGNCNVNVVAYCGNTNTLVLCISQNTVYTAYPTSCPAGTSCVQNQSGQTITAACGTTGGSGGGGSGGGGTGGSGGGGGGSGGPVPPAVPPGAPVPASETTFIPSHFDNF